VRFRSIVKAQGIIGFFVGISRVFGVIRDMAFASLLGTSLVKSAFDVGFMIPNLFRRLFGEGALSAAFIPVFTDSLQSEGKESAFVLANRVITMLTVFLSVVSVAGIALISLYLWFVHPGEKAFLAMDLLRVMLPYALLICLVGMFTAILNSFLHFAVPASTPILLNLIMIATMWWICPLVGNTKQEHAYWIAVAVLVAGLVQVGFQLPMLYRFGFKPRASFDWSDSRIRKILVLMLPVALGMGVTQINIVVGTLLAYWAADWAPATLTYAGNVVYLPHGLFATSLGTVLLPVFSRYVTNSDIEGLKQTMNSSLRHLMFIMIPAAVGIMVLASPIIRLIYERGSFTAESTMLTSRALFFYAPGLLAFSLCKVFIPAFYAMKDTSTPVRVSIWAIIVSFSINVAGVIFLPLHYKHVGIVVGSVIGETINGVALAWIFTRRSGSPGWARIFGSISRMAFAATAMGVGVYFTFYRFLPPVVMPGLKGTLYLGMNVLGSIGAGVLIYAVVICVISREEFNAVVSALKRVKKPDSPVAGNGN